MHIWSAITKAGSGRLHKGGLGAFGGQPIFVKSLWMRKMLSLGAFANSTPGNPTAEKTIFQVSSKQIVVGRISYQTIQKCFEWLW